MEPKNRLMIVIAVTLLILGAILASFGRSVLSLDPPPVVLPSANPSGSSLPSGVSPFPEDTPYQRVEVTPKTVQSVIGTLSRMDSFYRELTVETFWGESSSVTQVRNWTDSGWNHTRSVLPSGVIRHDLVGDSTLHYWYEGSSRCLSAAADDFTADLSQRIPTYETVLSLDPASITEAGYVLRDEFPCIYAAAENKELDLVTRFWVCIDSGLLISAEQEQHGRLVYRMTSYGPVQYPCPSNVSFALPDGTVLHEVG